MSLSRIEQEVIITYNASEERAIVYASIPAQIRKLDGLCSLFPNTIIEQEVYKHDGVTIAKSYTLPKKLITIRKPRVLTNEQKQKLAKRLSESRISDNA